MRPYVLSECNWDYIKKSKYDLAILPWGATEAHNYHLPFGTDNYEVEAIACESAKLAWENGAKVIVLPFIPFGVNTGQKGITLTININPSTQLKILMDIAENMQVHNINKLLIMNGHGGNDFKQMLREIGNNYPKMLLCSCNWYQAIDKSAFFDHQGDHADEMETSLMMYLYPELVLPLAKAGDGKYKIFKIQAFNEGWAWTERKWIQITNDTGVGNPKKASPEKGEKYYLNLVTKLSQFIVELTNIKGTDMYV